MLAGALCAGAGFALVKNPVAVSADEPAAKTYSLTKVFNAADGAIIGSEQVGGKETTAFTLKNGSAVEYNNDLAYVWKTSETETEYLNLTFAFKDLNFTSISFVFENTPAQATKDDKSVNTVKFESNGTAVKAGVLNGDEETATMTDITLADSYVLEIGAGSAHGEYEVTINGVSVGTMTNVGANYADFESVDTLVIEAKAAAEATPVVYLKNLNGQAFDNITTEGEGENAKKVVSDDALPVLVVNDTVSGFLLGTQFSLNYAIVDVLDTTPSCDEKYYQYNPADETVEYADGLGANVYFMPTTMYVKKDANDPTNKALWSWSKTKQDGYTRTSIYEEYDNREFVSIRFTLGDDEHNTADKETVADLAWYVADPSDLVSITQGEAGSEVTTDFLVLDRNEEGPTLRNFTEDDVQLYQDKLDAIAAEKYVGEAVELPSLAWLFDDNNGYQSLEFMASYRTPASTSAQSWGSTKKFNKLEITTSEEGLYEFKIFVTDKAGNEMKAMLDGEEVSVTKNNVWDIDEIPTFRFTIKNQGIKADEKSNKLTTKVLGATYSMGSVNITGAERERSDAVLYKVDLSKYNGLTAEVLAAVEYSELQKKVNLANVQNGNYFELYLNAYVELIAAELELADNDTAARTAIKSCFKLIDKSEEEYKWNASSKSFTAAQEGVYMILADYWDEEFAYVDRVAAYVIVEVDAEADEIEGENNWFKNNMVSIILFAIAGVMLVLIIILLLIKPSDETLEDVDKKAKEKKTDNKN